jgi:hypothetical protein
MDLELQKLGAELTIVAAALGIVGFFFRQWIVSSIAKSSAEKGALNIKDDIIALKDEVIKTLRMEMRDREADWQLRLDRKEKDLREFRLKVMNELATARKISRSMSEELRVINDGRFPEQRQNTHILITGLGPLDPDPESG